MISLQRAKQQFDAILQQLSVSDRQAFSQYVLKTLSKGIYQPISFHFKLAYQVSTS